MLVFWDQRLVLLATPKTGSTALADALQPLTALAITRPPALKHTTMQRYHRFVGPYLKAASGFDFEVVALMREPRDWLGSWFRFRQRETVDNPAKGTRGLTFEQFVLDYCRDPQPEHAAVGAQSRFLGTQSGRGVDRLFRYETMDVFLRFLEDRLDFEIVLPRVNVSPEAALELTAATEATLRRRAAEDFELYAGISTG